MTTKVDLGKIVHHLNDLLAVRDFDESAINGLQVAGAKKTTKVAFAVDGVLETFKEAAKQNANLLIVHHGIYWGFQYALRGADYKRIKTLMDHDIALYAVHLPLDAHMVHGHAANLLRELGCQSLEPFGRYKGMTVGAKGVIPETQRDAVIEKLTAVLGDKVQNLPFGPEKIKTIGCVTGQGADFSTIKEAKINGVHLMISGEANHPIYHYCKEQQMNLALGGHYRTEVFGLHSLRRYVEETFQLETVFIDHPTGM